MARRRSNARQQEDAERLTELLAATAEFRRRFGRREGVVGVSYGLKREQKKDEHFPGVSRGRGEWAILVFVEKKLDAAELLASRRKAFDETFQGFSVDVVEVDATKPGVLAAANPDDVHDPVVGGVTLGLLTGGVLHQKGTACIVGKIGNQPRLLTCAHVLRKYDPASQTFPKDPNAEILQPAALGNAIGKESKWVRAIDAGLIRLVGRPGAVGDALGEPNVFAVDRLWTGSPLPPDLPVAKYGAMPPHEAEGRITVPNFPSKPFHPIGTLFNLIQILGEPGIFAVEGDSGAPVIAEIGGEMVLIGMVVGIEAAGSKIAYAMPIPAIVAEFGFSIN